MKRTLLGLLRRLLPDDWASDVVRDLDEAHARKRDRAGAARATVWLLGQTFAFGARFTVERLRELCGQDPGS